MSKKLFISVLVCMILTSLLLVPSGVFGVGEDSTDGDAFYFEGASITVADYEGEGITETLEINLEETGLKGMINLSYLEDHVYVIGGSIVAREDAVLEITNVSTGKGAKLTGADVMEVIDEETGSSRELKKGVNTLDLAAELGNADPQGDGISLGYLRELLGNTVILEGVLTTDAEGLPRDVVLNIILGGLSFGDINYSAEISVADAILVLRHIVGLASLDAGQKMLADVDADGSIAVSDAILILRYIVGLVDDFPVEAPLALQQASINVLSETRIPLTEYVIDDEMIIHVSLSDDGLKGELILPLGERDVLGDITQFTLTGGSVTVNKKATFVLTGITTGDGAEWSGDDLMDELADYDKSMNLDKGLNNYLLSDYIEDADTEDDEADTDNLREQFGDEIIIEGLLFSMFGDREHVSLKVRFTIF